MNQIQTVDEEKKELQEILERYDRYPKLSKWIQLFLDKSNMLRLETLLNQHFSHTIARIG